MRQEEQKIRVLKIIPLSYRARTFGRLDTVVKQFELHSSYQPAGDQPAAIDHLVNGIDAGLASQVLLGVTHPCVRAFEFVQRSGVSKRIFPIRGMR